MKQTSEWAIVAVAILFLNSSCGLRIWPFGGEKAEEKSGSMREAVEPENNSLKVGPPEIQAPTRTKSKLTANDEIELRQAKIWNRLDEMDDQLKVQKEKLKLLEQGLLTGVAPEALKSGNSHSREKSKTVKSADGGLPSVSLDDAMEKKALTPKSENASELTSSGKGGDDIASAPESYTVKLQVAKDYFQAGRFGLAIAELAQISRDFGANIGDGEHFYWLGRSYLGLKEYPTARAELESYIKGHPQSALKPVARLEIARALMGSNLRERARKELSQIARDYQGQDAGETASMELKNLQGTL